MSEGLASLLKYSGGFAVSGREARFDRASVSSLKNEAEVIVIFEDLLSEEGMRVLEGFRKASKAKVILLGSSDANPHADAIVDPSLGSSEIFASIRSFCSQNGHYEADLDRQGRNLGTRLSPREKDVARLIARGLSNRSIAESLGVQEQSIKNCVSSLMSKLGCENRVQVLLRVQGTEVLSEF
jgi:DNA-binding NarL/FixJ family response regulator